MYTGFNILKQYQTFTNLEAMNESVACHIEHSYLNTNSVNVLNYVAKLASRHNGACRALYATIADKLSISTRTVNRCIKALKEAGIIAVFLQRRKSLVGGSASNIITILPFIDSPDVALVDVSPTPVKDVPNATESKGNELSASPSNLLINSELTKNNTGHQEAVNLVPLFSEFVGYGLTKDKFLMIVAEAKTKAKNLKAYVRKVCMNFIDNKREKQESMATQSVNPFSQEARAEFLAQKQQSQLKNLFNPWEVV
ncbi:hypothetical protein FM106_14930 [Brachybacterium faecium]|nr:hypothetical protein FM106_14930 [Brachybacterium faecium]